MDMLLQAYSSYDTRKVLIELVLQTNISQRHKAPGLGGIQYTSNIHIIKVLHTLSVQLNTHIVCIFRIMCTQILKDHALLQFQADQWGYIGGLHYDMLVHVKITMK